MNWKEAIRALVVVGVPVAALLTSATRVAEGLPAREGTTLSDKTRVFHKADDHTVTLRHGPITTVVVDNEAFGETHRSGYNGIASLTHEKRPENLFVPRYAGLNLELIMDGRKHSRERFFEPRRVPMELRLTDDHAAELYQPPTPTWHLESCTRFELEGDGTIHVTFECVARKKVDAFGYLALFWASYVQQPEVLGIRFRGREGEGGEERWITASSPAHGVDSTHRPAADRRTFARAPDFPPAFMLFSHSQYRPTKPFYYGVSHGMALVYIFRERDLVWFAQSPSGGGKGNPAWDFAWLIPDYEIGKIYRLELRALYVPFKSEEEIEQLYATQSRKWSP